MKLMRLSRHGPISRRLAGHEYPDWLGPRADRGSPDLLVHLREDHANSRLAVGDTQLAHRRLAEFVDPVVADTSPNRRLLRGQPVAAYDDQNLAFTLGEVCDPAHTRLACTVIIFD